MPVAQGPKLAQRFDVASGIGPLTWAAPPGTMMLVDLTPPGTGRNPTFEGDQHGACVVYYSGALPAGFTQSPSDLNDVWALMTTGADATGAVAPRPILSGTSRERILHVPYDRALTIREPLRTPSPQMLDSLRLDYARLRLYARSLPLDHPDRDIYLRWIATKADAGFAGVRPTYPDLDYRDLQFGLPSEEPIRPQTTQSDNFNRADESLDAGNWTEVQGNWSVTSNQAVMAGADARGYARYNTGVATDDHHSQLTVFDSGAGNGWAISRFAAAATQGYYHSLQQYNDTQHLRRFDNGTGETSLANTTSFTITSGDTCRIESDGSSHEAYHNGTLRLGPVTDTTYSGQTQGGMGRYENDHAGDDWSMGDLTAAASLVIPRRTARNTLLRM